jgi:glycine cleavage system H protein
MGDMPSDLNYAESHEWLRLESDGTAVIGISDHAQDALGDVVYVELPDIGAQLDAGAEVAVVESVKAASDIYSPVTGEILMINEALEDQPDLVNSSPYADGWLFCVRLDNPEELNSMLDADAYQSVVDDA